jgi:hypothetical protein
MAAAAAAAAAACAAAVGCDCAAGNGIGEAGAAAVAKALESGQCGLTSLYLECEADSARALCLFRCVGALCAMVDADGGGVDGGCV